MVFSSSIFLFLFLPTVLFIYYIVLRRRTARNVFLLLSSLFFYAWGEPWFVFVMIFSIIGNWAFGLLVEKNAKNVLHAKLVVTTAVLFNLSILFVFKYLIFTLKTSNWIFRTDFNVPTILLPIGISFFTFQALSYVIDVYRSLVSENADGRFHAQRNPLNIGLYIALFPQLIAGPIVRYSTIADQIHHRKENFDDFSSGVCRFIFGLAKKAILANSIAIVVDQIYATPASELTTATAWLGAIGYTFQIYFDFSGYSDMAIGLGRMFGFHFLENFNYPYISQSVTEFWRRWHISLGTWFRDYVYFPLGGSRVSSKLRLIFNLFVVWTLTGVWHGANWTFIFWGLLYFVLLTLEKLTGFSKWLRYGSGIIYTLFFVNLGWVVFRSESLAQAFDFIRTMFALGGQPLADKFSSFYWTEHLWVYLACLVCSTPLAKKFTLACYDQRWFQLASVPTVMFLFVLTLCFVVQSTYNPFIYFNF